MNSIKKLKFEHEILMYGSMIVIGLAPLLFYTKLNLILKIAFFAMIWIAAWTCYQMEYQVELELRK